ncbi:MAG: hypothetical protein ICV83_15335 [Cytophagales bacterium]|nr:hypothetical protein [Cytophagales bacterium]
MRHTQPFFVAILLWIIAAIPVVRAQDTIRTATPDRPYIKSLFIKSGLPDFLTHELNPEAAEFGDTIGLVVAHRGMFGDAREGYRNPVVLYLDGTPMQHIPGYAKAAGQDTILFALRRAGDEQWNELLSKDFFTKSYLVAVGFRDGSVMSANAVPLQFSLRNNLYENFLIGLFFVLLIAFTASLIGKKDMLREETGGTPAYSLAKTQLWYWSSIILFSFFVIWYITDDINTIEPSSLILLGISLGTSGVSKVIENAGTTGAAAAPAAQRSGGFWTDLLTESGVVTVHRFQIVMFNLVVGFFFIFKVFGTLRMPVLNDTLLLLMGLSSATFTTLKALQVNAPVVPGNTLPVQPPGTPPAPVDGGLAGARPPDDLVVKDEGAHVELSLG